MLKENNKKTKTFSIIPDERIVGKIYLIRSMKVMLDKDLAELYGVETRVLNQAVKRNIKRFPVDFMFRLNKAELRIWKSKVLVSEGENSLRSQNVILETETRRGRYTKYTPTVFTEQGVAMLSSVLNSDRAIQVNIQIIRTFTKLREMLANNKNLANKIEAIERDNEKSKENFKVIFKAISRLIAIDPKDQEIKIIGFTDRK